MDDGVPVVCLNRCSVYEPTVLSLSLEGLLASLRVPAALPSGTRVLLKPNLISVSAPSLACTHAFVISAVAAWFIDHGCKVAVGDSPAFGSALNVLQRQGIYAALKGMNVKFVEFTTVVPRELSQGVVVGVASEALDCDLLVNLPKIKAHDQMYVTMAVKNIFGIVKGIRKSWLHMKHGNSCQKFAQIVMDLHGLLPETLVVADAVEVMHQHGPVWGESLSLGCLAASKSAIALDCAMLDALQLDWRRSPLAIVAQERGMLGADIADIIFPLLQPADFYGSGFVAPQELNPIRFRPWRYVKNSLKRIFLGF